MFSRAKRSLAGQCMQCVDSAVQPIHTVGFVSICVRGSTSEVHLCAWQNRRGNGEGGDLCDDARAHERLLIRLVADGHRAQTRRQYHGGDEDTCGDGTRFRVRFRAPGRAVCRGDAVEACSLVRLPEWPKTIEE